MLCFLDIVSRELYAMIIRFFSCHVNPSLMSSPSLAPSFLQEAMRSSSPAGDRGYALEKAGQPPSGCLLQPPGSAGLLDQPPEAPSSRQHRAHFQKAMADPSRKHWHLGCGVRPLAKLGTVQAQTHVSREAVLVEPQLTLVPTAYIPPQKGSSQSSVRMSLVLPPTWCFLCPHAVDAPEVLG